MLALSNQTTYFSANRITEKIEAKLGYYDRQTGTISYQIPKTARVHIQAGTAVVDAVRKKPKGPVLKTLVNREPRIAGTVIEHWNGYAEDGHTYIPELKNFVLAIAGTALPDNSVITIGNNSKTFLQSIADRKGKSLFTFTVTDHHHHQGLTTLDDISPNLKINLVGAEWSEKKSSWKIADNKLKFTCDLEGPTASSFSKQPGQLVVYLDGNEVHRVRATSPPVHLQIPLSRISASDHLLAVDWASEYGPTAAGVIHIETKTAVGENQ